LRITQRYDKKLDSVTNKDDSIEVHSGREISARVSSEEGNLLSVKAGKGLYVSAPVLKKLTFGADKEYVYDGTEDVTVPVYKGEYYEE
jgi:hypothetical protein